MSFQKLCRICLDRRHLSISKLIRSCSSMPAPVLCKQKTLMSRRLSHCFTNRKSIYPLSKNQFSTDSKNGEMSELLFDQVANESLENLSDQLEELGDRLNVHADFDVQCIDGVLTLRLGGDLGTYVINKQTPNKQIWLSSPTSGPKRYDYMEGGWIYKHDGVPLLKLLSNELSIKLKEEIKFSEDS